MALATLSGCMWAPVNQDFSLKRDGLDKTKPVTFAGALLTPSTEVTIQAQDPQTKTWKDIGKAISADYEWPTGSSRYNWVEHQVIPNTYWAQPQECAIVGERALVRSSWAGGYLASFATPDMWYCRGQHPDDVDFVNNCKAPESPNVLVPAVGYRDFGKECAARINWIRSQERKPPLQIDEAGECGADSDAKCNYEWELTNPEPHKCNHGVQNECSYKGTSSLDGILYGQNSCLMKMYAEKACYESCMNNPSCRDYPTFPKPGCYHGTDAERGFGCECGHYVNMVVDSTVKSVSCGLYEVIDQWGNSQFKAVQNFK